MPTTNPRQTYYTAKSLIRARWLLERVVAVDDAFAAFEVRFDLGEPLLRLSAPMLRAVRHSSRVEFRDELELQKDARGLVRWLAPSQNMLGQIAPLPG